MRRCQPIERLPLIDIKVWLNSGVGCGMAVNFATAASDTSRDRSTAFARRAASE
jgi:hypothetical protein